MCDGLNFCTAPLRCARMAARVQMAGLARRAGRNRNKLLVFQDWFRINWMILQKMLEVAWYVCLMKKKMTWKLVDTLCSFRLQKKRGLRMLMSFDFSFPSLIYHIWLWISIGVHVLRFHWQHSLLAVHSRPTIPKVTVGRGIAQEYSWFKWMEKNSPREIFFKKTDPDVLFCSLDLMHCGRKKRQYAKVMISESGVFLQSIHMT